jgi:phenylacetate-CoA ligase
MFWNEELETISRPELEKLQVEFLRKSVAQAQKSPSYREALKGCPAPEEIRDVRDIRSFPFTTKDDLRDAFPSGMMAVPRDEIIRLHSSSGTTGRATVIYHTAKDIDTWADIMARCIYMAGVRRSDVFQNIIGYGLFTGGLGLHYGMEKVGALTIPSGTGNSKRQIRLMQDFGTTVVHATPSYALHLADIFAEMGLNPASDVKLRIGFFGAEPHTEAVSKRLEEIYDITAFNSYGLSEMNGPGVGMNCPRKHGVHIWEDHYLLEVIDPQTLEPMPDGQPGELVLTTLRREGMPLIRYRTKDLTMVLPELCPCGRTHRCISRISGRTDDMLIISGVNLFPMQIEKVLMETPQLGNNYLIVLESRGHLDVLSIKVEVVDEALFGDLNALKKLQVKLVEDLRSELLVTPRVEFVEPNSLPKSEGKAVRVIDNRKD